jgi:hypothetical protein
VYVIIIIIDWVGTEVNTSNSYSRGKLFGSRARVAYAEKIPNVFVFLTNPFLAKGKVHPITRHEGPKWEQICNSNLPLNSALDGVGGQWQAPTALTPG